MITIRIHLANGEIIETTVWTNEGETPAMAAEAVAKDHKSAVVDYYKLTPQKYQP